MITWATFRFDRQFTEAECAEIEAFLRQELELEDDGLGPGDNFGVDGNLAYFGWLHFNPHTREGDDLIDGLLARAPGISCTLEMEYDECDEPGTEYLWYGPRALELELKHAQALLDDAQRNVRRIKAALARRGR